MPDDDQAVIEYFCQRAAVAAMADLIRADGGQLALPRAEIEVSTAPQLIEPDVPKVRCVTVTPVPEVVDDRSWWERLDKVSLALRTLGVLTGLTLCGVVAWLVIMAAQAIAAAVTALVPVLLTVAGVIVIIVLLSSLGGDGGSFSGTFGGRMH